MNQISNGILPDYMISYLREKLPERRDEILNLEEYAKENIVPIIQPEIANLLKFIVATVGAKKILEIGTAIGYSALIFEESIIGEGKITSIEINQEKAEIAKKNISEYKTNELVDIEVLTGDALDILPEIKEKYDIIFIDAGKSHYIKYFDLTNKLLEGNGIIISDNVLYKGMISSDHLVVKRKRTIVRNMREYIDYITSKENFFTTILPLGDGIAISKKNGDEANG